MGLLQQGQQAQAPAPVAAPGVAELAQAAAAAGAPPPGAPPAGAPPQQAAGAPPSAAAVPPAAPEEAPRAGGKATGEGVNLPEEEASPEEQAEYERAMAAVTKALYSSEKLSNSIVDQVNPEDKIDSTSKVAMLLIQQLDTKANFDEVVVPEVTQEVVTRIAELAEARHNMSYGEDEMQIILSTTFEGVAEMFGGMDEQSFQDMSSTLGPENLQGLKQNHEAALRG